MNLKLANEKSKQLQISTNQIVREEYEMILLSSIFNSSIGETIVFRGGTALRLAYASPRFSDDLDFSLTKMITFSKFKSWCQQAESQNQNIELVEAVKKYFTLFALFKIKDTALAQTLSIKVEISTRLERWDKNKDYSLIVLKSEVTPITVFAQVATITKIEKEKLSITPPRIRDIFDLWFISQKLNKNYQINFGEFNPNDVKRELNKLLPVGQRRLIESWLK